jgi:CO/xanthine dehydrogenase Mo-binding subunit
VLNLSYLHYKVPLVFDVLVVLSAIVEKLNHHSPHGAKGSGAKVELSQQHRLSPEQLE